MWKKQKKILKIPMIVKMKIVKINLFKRFIFIWYLYVIKKLFGKIEFKKYRKNH